MITAKKCNDLLNRFCSTEDEMWSLELIQEYLSGAIFSEVLKGRRRLHVSLSSLNRPLLEDVMNSLSDAGFNCEASDGDDSSYITISF